MTEQDFIGIRFYDYSFPQGTREVKSYFGNGEYYCPLVETKYDDVFDYYCSWNVQEIQKIVDARVQAGYDVKSGRKVANS